jgi:ribose transport system substrate-binding protein
MLLFPGDSKLANDWSKEAADAGVPVLCVMIDSDPIDGSPDPNVSAYVGSNDYQMCYDLAKRVIEDNGADAGLGVVRINGVPGQKDWIDRDLGFSDGISENSNYALLGETAWAYSSRADAQAMMEDFIGVYGDQIDVLVGFDDDVTLGGVYALEAAGITDVQVYSVTGMKEGIQAVKDGKIKLIVSRSMQSIASRAVECLETLMAGGTFDYYQYIDTPYITPENADEFEGEY